MIPDVFTQPTCQVEPGRGRAVARQAVSLAGGKAERRWGGRSEWEAEPAPEAESIISVGE